MATRIHSFEEYKIEYEKSINNPEKFWAEQADTFYWQKKWDKVLEWNFNEPLIKWYAGGKLNITENCLDRHLKEKANQIAYIWEPNNPNEKELTFTYQQLYDKVCNFANVLKNNGVKKGDTVCIYMPMVPELLIATLACARIGAIHSVIFAGFSSEALASRINDAQAKILLTADGAYRGTKQLNLKSIVDDAVNNCPAIKRIIILERTGGNININKERDLWWHDEINKVNSQCEAEIMDSEDPLFILYTSGSTGKPKGIVHTVAGYMVYTDYSFKNVFQYNEGDIYWCTADIGWITGHSYMVYAPLLSGATSVMFEGIPTYPNASRFWQIIEKHLVTIFYTSPTAIRSLEAEGIDYVTPYKLNSLKVLGSVGEPINVEAWNWYNKNIGHNKCPIVDTWWQTETGGISISPLAGITANKPSYAMLPLPGIQPIIVDNNGEELKGNDIEGHLCIKFPWPGMLRTIFKNHERCKETYFSMYKNLYFTGDGCKRDADGHYKITGRVDDVIKVSGHLLGTAEIENAINQHPNIVESAIVGYPHTIKGNAIYAFAICYNKPENETILKQEVINIVTNKIGAIAKPEKIQFVNALPKTRSGKIMRRILRKIAAGTTKDLGDTSTLLDPSVVEEIINGNIN